MQRTDQTTLELGTPQTLDEHVHSAGLLVHQEVRIPSGPQAPVGYVPSAIVVGSLKGYSKSGFPEVDFPGNPESNPVPARTTVELNDCQVGCELVLVFAGGDPRRPIILGVIQPVIPPPATSGSQAKPLRATLDGQQVILTADQEVVLRCGEASITLTRAGKVLINGEYLLSRSNGVNRIKGGSVQIN